jgi:hypothetical protein
MCHEVGHDKSEAPAIHPSQVRERRPVTSQGEMLCVLSYTQPPTMRVPQNPLDEETSMSCITVMYAGAAMFSRDALSNSPHRICARISFLYE